jgi:hypothetical protein
MVRRGEGLYEWSSCAALLIVVVGTGEGLTFDAARMRIYTSLSEVVKGMANFTSKGQYTDAYDIGMLCLDT